ncbi:MAG: hypothetical protein H7Y88_10385 [Phycisphaerales bacterium]|nr:hypothetical protein [Phycisphaerales bacterium]
MGRTVILLHSLPDGTSHFDWLIEREPGDSGAPAAAGRQADEHGALTFRLMVRPDDPAATSFAGTRLPDHRTQYFDYEGSVAGRGEVRRVAAGEARIERYSTDELVISVLFGESRRGWRGIRVVTLPDRSDERWIFRLDSGWVSDILH